MSRAGDKRPSGRRRGLLFIVSAPSGAGKTTLCTMAARTMDNIRYSTSFTTRAPREGEEDGVDYHFVDRREFQDMIDRNDFLEWAEVHGNMYGTSLSELESLLEEGYDTLLDIDVQGANQIRERVEERDLYLCPPPFTRRVQGAAPQEGGGYHRGYRVADGERKEGDGRG